MNSVTKEKIVEEEDDELAALRMAALATMKSRVNKLPEPSSIGTVENISSVDSVSQHSRRNPVQQGNRRGVRGRIFPKGNQRSNLIVITPVAINTEESSCLSLPQLNSNRPHVKNSSDTTSFRKTGPTRFNRHESGSESSDSDFENSDDNSYSNDTILQDEHPEHASPKDESTSESFVEKENGHVVSFQSIDSTLSTGTSCRNTFSSDEDSNLHSAKSTSDRKSAIKTSNDSKSLPEDAIAKSESENHRSLLPDYSEKLIASSVKPPPKNHDCSAVNGDFKKHSNVTVSQVCLYTESDVSSNKSRERYSQSNRETSSDGLHKNDLRLQLKRKVQEQKSTQSSGILREASKKCLNSNQHKEQNNRRREHDREFTSRKRNSRSHSQSLSPARSRTSQNARSDRNHGSSQVWYGGRNPARDRVTGSDKRSRERSRSPVSAGSDRSHKRASSLSSSSSDSDDSTAPMRSVSSVVKPVFKSWEAAKNSTTSDSASRRSRDPNEKPVEARTLPISTLKSSIQGGENINKALDNSKRVPVHMRLGSLSKKRVIPRTKDVEAAFFNSSSEDDLSVTCEKDNSRVVTEVHRNKYGISTIQPGKNSQKNSSAVGSEKAKRIKVHR